MKKLFFLIILILTCSVSFAQDVKRNGTTFTVVAKQKQQDVQTEYTYQIKDMIYPIYVTRNGACYILRTSKKGNVYKQYLKEEIAETICKELGITRKPRK